uniref:Reverse transcriptase zinc-binding domain-containing protein n=1 Tax=Noccaea caerulescens TaxID=107243 RepID=A0A1J3GN53_NOCCA
MWLVFLGRLPTKDRLRRWGMNVPEVCVLCSSHQESHGHLFFSCSFTKEIYMAEAKDFCFWLVYKPHNSEAYAAGHSLRGLERKKWQDLLGFINTTLSRQTRSRQDDQGPPVILPSFGQ